MRKKHEGKKITVCIDYDFSNDPFFNDRQLFFFVLMINRNHGSAAIHLRNLHQVVLEKMNLGIIQLLYMKIMDYMHA